MIKIEKLVVSYGKEVVLKEVSLDISKGTSYAIIGPSGCGKTTLLYTMAGLIKEQSGEVKIDRDKVSLILQNLGLFPWKSSEDNIMMGLKKSNFKKEEKLNKVNLLLKELEIESIRSKYINELSGGQRQRVAIGRTLINNPEILLLDEATSALDAMTKEKIQELLLEIHLKRKNTMVFVTHSIEEAVFLGEKIIVMIDGRIKEVIENQYFGDREIRKKQEYFHVCNKVRSALYD
ncbi:MAG: ATP-binding cassette domain-containing protein [Clostridium sp.]